MVFYLHLLFCEAYTWMMTIPTEDNNNLHVAPDFQMTISQSMKLSQDIKNDKYLIKLLCLKILFY